MTTAASGRSSGTELPGLEPRAELLQALCDMLALPKDATNFRLQELFQWLQRPAGTQPQRCLPLRSLTWFDLCGGMEKYINSQLRARMMVGSNVIGGYRG